MKLGTTSEFGISSSIEMLESATIGFVSLVARVVTVRIIYTLNLQCKFGEIIVVFFT